MNQLDFAVARPSSPAVRRASVCDRAAARATAARRWRSGIATQPRLSAAQREHGFAHTSSRSTSRTRRACERAATSTAAALGGIDVLVCSAGVAGANHTTWDYPLDEWRKVIDINLNGVFHCNRAVVPVMQRRDYGRIVNIASIAGKEGNPTASAYSASKAARDRPHQEPRQGAREDRDPRQLRDARRRSHRDLRPDHAAAHRLHALEDPDRPLRHRRRDRLARVLARERGVLVLDRGACSICPGAAQLY